MVLDEAHHCATEHPLSRAARPFLPAEGETTSGSAAPSKSTSELPKVRVRSAPSSGALLQRNRLLVLKGGVKIVGFPEGGFRSTTHNRDKLRTRYWMCSVISESQVYLKVTIDVSNEAETPEGSGGGVEVVHRPPAGSDHPHGTPASCALKRPRFFRATCFRLSKVLALTASPAGELTVLDTVTKIEELLDVLGADLAAPVNGLEEVKDIVFYAVRDFIFRGARPSTACEEVKTIVSTLFAVLK